MNKRLSVILALSCLLLFPGVSGAQGEPEKLNWIQGGNCWVAEPGFLYCGHLHPYVEDNPLPFLSFACFEDYQAVLLSHEHVSDPSNIRTVESNFGEERYSDVWISATETETFMSNHISPGNDGYFNTLRGLGNTKSTKFEFSVSPGNVSGVIDITGDEHLIVGSFIDLCNAQIGQ